MYPKIPLLAAVVSFCSHCRSQLTTRAGQLDLPHGEETKELCGAMRRKTIVRVFCEGIGGVLSNMQGERAGGMRGAKRRSVLVIFVSEQAKHAPSHLSPYLSPARVRLG